MMYVRLKYFFWGIRLLTSMRIEMGSLAVKHKGEKNQMGFNTTLTSCACLSLAGFYCVTFTLVNAALLNGNESSCFQFLSNYLFLIVLQAKNLESAPLPL